MRPRRTSLVEDGTLRKLGELLTCVSTGSRWPFCFGCSSYSNLLQSLLLPDSTAQPGSQGEPCFAHSPGNGHYVQRLGRSIFLNL